MTRIVTRKGSGRRTTSHVSASSPVYEPHKSASHREPIAIFTKGRETDAERIWEPVNGFPAIRLSSDLREHRSLRRRASEQETVSSQKAEVVIGVHLEQHAVAASSTVVLRPVTNPVDAQRCGADLRTVDDDAR
jgi:hypothetical protein